MNLLGWQPITINPLPRNLVRVTDGEIESTGFAIIKFDYGTGGYYVEWMHCGLNPATITHWRPM